MTTPETPCCPYGRRLDDARTKALSEERHGAAQGLAEAMACHRRWAHPESVTRKKDLSQRVAEANALSRKAASRW
ncbi:hypothetical protein ACFP1Z_14900 [Streptomyces gamaensis]|uniref:Uncharacterized protein n=1 Tax=Streptomyces gamaensis TaxID=1763542 RepID=A0ABW0Z343_9ACTN